jgi:glycosyltransferase involved in cell wall biosynthesis
MGDPASCAAALHRLGNDRQLRQQFGSAGAVRVRQSFSIESYVRGVEEQFAEVLAEPAPVQEVL